MKPLVLALTGLLFWGLLTSFSRPLEPLTRIHGQVIYPNGLAVTTTWWRVGLILGRSDEEPLEAGGVTYQNQVVYREPEVWMVDVPRKAGRHVVDPGPSLGFHMAVALYRGDLEWKGEVLDLEVGREGLFMDAHGVNETSVEGEGSRRHRVWTDPATGVVADLTLAGPGGVPLGLELRSSEGPLVTLVYDDYHTGLPVDLGLFSPPEDVEFQE